MKQCWLCKSAFESARDYEILCEQCVRKEKWIGLILNETDTVSSGEVTT